MHFALPPRKTSFPPPYARVSARNATDRRRKQLQYLSYLVLATLTIGLCFRSFGRSNESTRHGPVSKDSTVVIVTVLDESKLSNEYVSMIKKNRDDYAARHGYKTFYTNTSTYAHLTHPSPTSWAVIPALRHALTLFHDQDYLWSLSPHAIITNPSVSLYDHIFKNLTSLALKNIPVVPPDSVIHTFSHLKPSQMHLILCQDADNIAHTSFLLRNTATIPVPSGQPKDYWSQFFLDAWFDPLYRSYAFQKAEQHAMEHIVQWHPTILAKLALVEQRLLNSYTFQSTISQDGSSTDVTTRKHDSMWRLGDLVVNLKGCAESKTRDCGQEMIEYFEIWEKQVASLDRITGGT